MKSTSFLSEHEDAIRELVDREDPDGLSSKMLDDSRLKSIEGSTVYIRFVNGSRLSLLELAQWIVQRKKSIGTDSAVALLTELLDKHRLPIFQITAICGASIPRSVQLLDGESPIPFSDLPESSQKQQLLNPEAHTTLLGWNHPAVHLKSRSDAN